MKILRYLADEDSLPISQRIERIAFAGTLIDHAAAYREELDRELFEEILTDTIYEALDAGTPAEQAIDLLWRRLREAAS